MPARPSRRLPPRETSRAARRSRRKSRTSFGPLAQVPYGVALAAAAAGVVWLSWDPRQVRGGTVALAGALIVAALARMVLPEGGAGLLVSRRRWADVAALGVLGVGLLVAVLLLRMPS